MLREYTDEREPVAFEQSDDGEVQRVDRIALLLQDHSGARTKLQNAVGGD